MGDQQQHDPSQYPNYGGVTNRPPDILAPVSAANTQYLGMTSS